MALRTKQSKDRIFCTYIYFDPKNGQPVYVGKGLPHRPFDHLFKKTNDRLNKLIKKRLNDGFDVQPHIIPAENEEDAIALERWLIEAFGRTDTNTGTLFNRTNGGDGFSGYFPSEESKKQMSLAHKKMSDEKKRLRSLRMTEGHKRANAKMSDEQKRINIEKRAIGIKEAHKRKPKEEKEKLAKKLKTIWNSKSKEELEEHRLKRQKWLAAISEEEKIKYFKKVSEGNKKFNDEHPEEKIKRGKLISQVKQNFSEEKKLLISKNISEGSKKMSEEKKEARKKRLKAKMQKKCTVDGIVIFDSKNDLIAVLGQGLNGTRSPSFRFL